MQFQNMIAGELIPSTQRIKEYLEASCLGPNCQERIRKASSCIAAILRLEEERLSPTEPELKEILALVESDKPAEELMLALAKISVSPQEPEAIEP